MRPSPSSNQMLQTAVAFFQRGNLPAADRACQELLKRRSKNADALHLHGVIADRQGNHTRAKTRLRKAVKLKPSSAQFHNSLALALRNGGELEPALAAAQRAIKLRPQFPGAYFNLGLIHTDREEYTQALDAFETACQQEHEFVQAHVNRGLALQTLGRMTEAQDAYRRALELQPSHAEAHFHLAHARRAEDPQDEQLAAIDELLTSDKLPRRVEGWLQSARGKISDDLRRYEEAFAAHHRANQLNTAGRVLGNVNKPLAEPIIDAFPRERFKRVKLNPPPRTDRILIVGMPRSGSTLLENMLATHPEVDPGGERFEIKRIWEWLANGQATAKNWAQANRGQGNKRIRPGDTHAVQAWAQANTDTLNRAAKLLETTLMHPAGARFLTDKTPGNLWLLGMVGRLMPDVPILFTWRDPRDTGLSCYFTRFIDRLHPYSDDLYACGRMIRATHMMIEHWLQVLPNPMKVVEYEAIVHDKEATMADVFQCCQLEVPDAPADHTRVNTAVATASSWQVRQKLYQRSVGRWKNYETHLKPLLEGLGPVGARPHPPGAARRPPSFGRG